jgi:hypothetical protein
MVMDLFEFAERQTEFAVVGNLVRHSDPDTSHTAAVDVGTKLTVRCQQFLGGLRQLGEATANEVAVAVADGNIGLVGSIRRRASDLHASGRISVVGRRECKITGKPVSVYAINDSISVVVSELDHDEIKRRQAHGFRIREVIPKWFGDVDGYLMVKR